MARSSGMSFCCPPMKWRIAALMPRSAEASWKTGRPASSLSDRWMCPLWPGQSRDHFAMKVAMRPQRCASTLVKVLNSTALSAARERLVDADRGLEHARPGLGVETLERHVHRPAGVEELAVELGMDRGAQDRVAEEPRRHRLQVAVALLAHRVRRLVEEEELVFERRQDREAHPGGLGEDAPQEPARADRLGLLGKLAQEERRAVLERQHAAGVGQDADGASG